VWRSSFATFKIHLQTAISPGYVLDTAGFEHQISGDHEGTQPDHGGRSSTDVLLESAARTKSSSPPEQVRGTRVVFLCGDDAAQKSPAPIFSIDGGWTRGFMGGGRNRGPPRWRTGKKYGYKNSQGDRAGAYRHHRVLMMDCDTTGIGAGPGAWVKVQEAGGRAGLIKIVNKHRAAGG